jgi:hypothetical protein
LTAYWNGAKVGEATITVTGEGTQALTCSLVNLRISVRDKNGFQIPFVSLNITYSYTTEGGSSRAGSASGQTDISGAFTLKSVLPGIDYTISASVYRVVFNSGNNTFTNIPAVPIHDMVILLPSRSLSLTIQDYKFEGLADARVALSEQTSGIFYSNLTNSAGTAVLDVAFGKYQLRVYKDNILLNETVLEVFKDTNTRVRCVLYNLQVSVLVTDYFGQPISNVNVDFRGSDQIARSNRTLANGVASFSNVVGGDAQVIAYSSDRKNYYEALSLHVESPTAVQMKMGKYVFLGGLLVETSLFLTIIAILPIIAFFAILEFYFRRIRSAKAQAKVGAPLSK